MLSFIPHYYRPESPVRDNILVEKCIPNTHKCPVRDMICKEKYCVPNGTPDFAETFIFYQYQIPKGIKKERIIFNAYSIFFTSHPEGFIIDDISKEEYKSLKSKFLTLKEGTGRGQHRKYMPKAFTEQGLYMLATILKGEKAEDTTVKIVQIRKVFLTANHANLTNRKCLISDICVRGVCVVRGKYGFSEWTQNLKSQFATSSWGGTRKMPLAFTQEGVAMLSGILHSKKAIEVQ